jgi:hypothetical protein
MPKPKAAATVRMCPGTHVGLGGHGDGRRRTEKVRAMGLVPMAVDLAPSPCQIGAVRYSLSRSSWSVRDRVAVPRRRQAPSVPHKFASRRTNSPRFTP